MGAYEGPTNFLNVGAAPSLMLNFAREKSLEDQISGKDLITFERASIGTYVGADGLIKTAAADEARFDHDANGNCLGLLIEESRTNLLTYSEDFNNGAWFKVIGQITPNSTTSPDGTLSADTFTINSGAAFARIDRRNLGLASNVYTLSYYLKNTVNQGAHSIEFYDSSLNVFVAVPSGIVLESNPEWRRIDITVDCSAEGLNGLDQIRLIFRPLVSPADGTNTVDLWGVQLEQGSFSTSYIPTSGSEFTREPDKVSITGTNFSSWYNQSEGTFFGYADIINSKYNDAISGFDGNNNNYTILGTGDSPNRFQLRFDDVEPFQLLVFGPNSTSVITTTLTIFPSLTAKIAGAIRQNDCAGAAQGQIIVTDTSIDMISPSALYLGTLSGSSEFLNGHIKQIIYYPARISDIKLQQMTKVFS
jgi:hypothetical protein